MRKQLIAAAGCLIAGPMVSAAWAQPFALERPAQSREILAFFGDYVDQCPGTDFWRGNRGYRGTVGNIVYEDLDNDGDDDDTTISHFFSMDVPLHMNETNPNVPCLVYRTEKHGAVFYGGMSVRYLNQTRNRIKQAFVHFEGANPNFVWGMPDVPFQGGEDGQWFRSGGPEPEEEREAYTEITLFPYVPNDHGPGEPSAFESVFMWRKDGFREWAQDRPIRFDEHSRMSYTFSRKWQNIQEARFVVRLGDDTFLVSEDFAPFGVEDLWGLDFIVSPLDMDWAPYAPAEGSEDMAFDADEAVFGPAVFDDVTAVGLYFGSEYSETATRIAFDHFRVWGALDGCEMADLAAPFGLYDLSDVIAFVDAIGTQNPIVDFNHDGLIDLMDINTFVAQFTAGCPD